MFGQGNGQAAKPNHFDLGPNMAPSQPQSGAYQWGARSPMDDVGEMNFTTHGPQYQPSLYGASLEGRYPDFVGPALAMPDTMEAAVPEPLADRAGRLNFAEHPSGMNAVENPHIDIANGAQLDPVHGHLENLNLRLKLVEKGIAEVLRNQKQQIQGTDHIKKQLQQFTSLAKEVMKN